MEQQDAPRRPSLERPLHLNPVYAQQFEDQSVVDAYPLRPPYPEAMFALLRQLLDPICLRILDVGCGTGEVARRVASWATHVDAVDRSPAMLAKGQQLPGGALPSLHWIAGEVETVDLSPPYGLVTAAASLHWMDWSQVLPRFSHVLSERGVLAIIREQSGTLGVNLEGLAELVKQFSTHPDPTPFDLVNVLTAHGLFTKQGEQWIDPVVVEQTIEEHIASIHTRSGFSRERMGEDAAAAFDRQAQRLLQQVCPEGKIVLHVRAHVVWGRPHDSAQENR